MRLSLYIALVAVFLLVSCQREDDALKPESLELEGYWKLKSYTVDPPLAGGIRDLSLFLDPCALQVTYYFKSNGTTMFLHASDACKANSNGVDLDNEFVSRWKFEGQKLIISNDYSPTKDAYDYQKIDDNTMTWKQLQVIPLPQNLGGDQSLTMIMTFVREAR